MRIKKIINKKRIAAVAMIAAAAAILCTAEKTKRRWWVRPWLREKRGAAGLKLVNEEFQTDPEQFKQYLRLSEASFKKLLNLVRPLIEKQDTRFRESVSARDKLIVTLRFLATGETYRSLMYNFRISESTISLFVPQVCQAIYDSLKDSYLKTPVTAADWLNVSKEFENIWNLPNVIGAMDGKHILFRPPASSGSIYYNYKGTHSIVLLAVVDAQYNFIYVDAGTNGRVSDGGVFRQSSLASAISNNELNIPEDKVLPGRRMLVPHVFVADAAFPLSEHILKPYPFRNMTEQQRIFNYRLSRARRVVENAFGILANRFRIFLTTINLKPEKVQAITLACCALHNFLKAESPTYFKSDDGYDKNYIFKFGLSHQSGNRPRASSLLIREEFKEFVNNEGAVHWQAALS